jgi:beta-galactosidase/beta-glucuronidase
VNPERWYYHADRHGVVVFQDVPEKYGNPTNATIPLYLTDLERLVDGPRANHPCIVQWTPFNEGKKAPNRHKSIGMVEFSLALLVCIRFVRQSVLSFTLVAFVR